MQIVTFNVAQGPEMQELDDRLYPAISAEVQIDQDVCKTDISLPDACVASRGLEQPAPFRDAITAAVKPLDLDSYAIEWLIAQIVMVLRVIMPHMHENRILRVVERVTGPDGWCMGMIRIEAPVWRPFRFGDWRQRRIDEKRFYSGLVTHFFDKADAQLFLLAHDGAPRVEREFAFGITAEDAHAEGVIDSVRGITSALPGDLGRFAPRLREAADAVSRMSMITKKVVRLYDIIRDSDGMGVAAYHIEAPYVMPDPDNQYPTEEWIDGIFRPDSKAAKAVA